MPSLVSTSHVASYGPCVSSGCCCQWGHSHCQIGQGNEGVRSFNLTTAFTSRIVRVFGGSKY